MSLSQGTVDGRKRLRIDSGRVHFASAARYRAILAMKRAVQNLGHILAHSEAKAFGQALYFTRAFLPQVTRLFQQQAPRTTTEHGFGGVALQCQWSVAGGLLCGYLGTGECSVLQPNACMSILTSEAQPDVPRSSASVMRRLQLAELIGRALVCLGGI